MAKTTTTAKPTKGKKSTATPPAAFVLLDRTGSMSRLWSEAVPAVNAYATTLGKNVPDALVTLATFDSHAGQTDFQVLRDGVRAGDWKPITGNETPPRGMTPLLDATMRLIGMANQTGATKTSIVIMTDGEENCSREAKRPDVQAALARCQERGWDVTFLGANFDAFAEAGRTGVAAQNTMSVAAGHMAATMDVVAAKSASYSMGTRAAGDAFTAEERRRSGWKG